jgi:hypothetical protein
MADKLPFTINISDQNIGSNNRDRFSTENVLDIFTSNFRDEQIIEDEEDYDPIVELIGSDREGYGPKVTASDSEIPEVEYQVQPGSYDRPGWMYNPPSLKFEEWRDEAYRVFQTFGGTNRLKDYINDDLLQFKEPFRSNLRRFIVKLVTYSRSHGKISIEFLWKNSLLKGPQFAVDYDQLRSAILGKMLKLNYLSPEILEIKNKYVVPDIKDYNFEIADLYRSNDLFNWDAPETSIQETSYDPVEINFNSLQLFRDAVKKILSNPKLIFYEETNLDEIYNDTSKMSFNGPVYQQRKVEPAFQRGLSRTAHIPRELKGKRAACVEEYASSIRIRWIERAVARILKADPRSKAKLDGLTLRRELERAIKEEGYSKYHSRSRGYTQDVWSYCRDFRKEGLTKPRILLRVMLEELHERFPKEKAFECPRFFDDWRVLDTTGEILLPPRGHGLGMANSLTTLMQLAIEEMNLHFFNRRFQRKPKYSGYVNDDACIIFKSKNEAELYCEIDRKTCQLLSLSFKTKASFLAKGYVVLCEQYARYRQPRFSRKRIYARLEFAQLLYAVNASHARSLASSMNVQYVPASWFEEVFTYWGFVLFRNEHRYPRGQGGWFRQIKAGVDFSYLLKPSRMFISDEATAAKWAYENTTWNPMPWKKGKFKAFKKKGHDRFDHDFRELVGLNEHLTEETMYRPNARPENTTLTWRRYQYALRQAYKFSYRKIDKKTWYDAWIDETTEHPYNDTLPPRTSGELVSCVGKTFTKDVEFHHPYARWDLESDYSLYCDNQKNHYCIKANQCNKIELGWPSVIGDKKANSSAEAANKIKFEFLKFRVRPVFYHAYVFPDDKSLSRWHNPFHVQKVVDSLIPGGYYTMIPPPNGMDAALVDRSRLYGRELSVKEWLGIGSINPFDRKILINMLRNTDLKNSFKSRNLDMLLSLFRKYPGAGHFFNYSTTKPVEQVIDWHTQWARVCHFYRNRHKLVDDEYFELRPIDMDEFYDFSVPPAQGAVDNTVEFTCDLEDILDNQEGVPDEPEPTIAGGEAEDLIDELDKTSSSEEDTESDQDDQLSEIGSELSGQNPWDIIDDIDEPFMYPQAEDIPLEDEILDGDFFTF